MHCEVKKGNFALPYRLEMVLGSFNTPRIMYMEIRSLLLSIQLYFIEDNLKLATMTLN